MMLLRFDLDALWKFDYNKIVIGRPKVRCGLHYMGYRRLDFCCTEKYLEKTDVSNQLR